MADGPPAVAQASTAPTGPAAHGKARRRPRYELPLLVALALSVAIVIKLFLVQAFSIPSVSMEPTLHAGDRILVCRVCLRFGEIDRGDVIVFEGPAGTAPDRGLVGSAMRWVGEAFGIAQAPHEDFVKRVAGLPGDVVEIDRVGQLFVNGSSVPEPYLSRPVPAAGFGPTTVPPGMLFVLGDNRANSGDSRCDPPSCTGLVPEERVIGVVFARVWPPGRAGLVR